MARTQTIVQLTDEMIAQLDLEASRRHLSRSALIREAITTLFAQSKEQSIGDQIVEGYQRTPPGTPDEWGDLDAQVEQSSLELLQRLDLEERNAGLEPW